MFRFSILLCLLFGGVARADVIPWEFGSPIPLDVKSALNVRLQSETFRAQIFYDHATAQATYRFRNDGAATSVVMAFPGELPRWEEKSAIKPYFRARLDGKSARFRRETKGEMFEAVTRYLGRVRFERGQTRVLQVEIRTATFSSLMFDADLQYKFGEAKWKGETRGDIGLELRAPGTFIVSAFRSDEEDFDLQDAVAMEMRENRCRFVSEQTPRGYLDFSLTATSFPGWLTREGSENPFERTLVVPGKARGFYQAGFWAPPALAKGGVSYLNIVDLAEQSGNQSETAEAPIVLTFDDATRKATLSANGHKLQLTPGSTQARLDGRAFALRAAPFFADFAGHDSGGGEVLYAPLTDVARAVGAKFNVNSKARRFYFALPTTGE